MSPKEACCISPRALSFSSIGLRWPQRSFEWFCLASALVCQMCARPCRVLACVLVSVSWCACALVYSQFQHVVPNTEFLLSLAKHDEVRHWVCCSHRDHEKSECCLTSAELRQRMWGSCSGAETKPSRPKGVRTTVTRVG